MKRLHDIKENLKVEDMASAARRAFRGHTGDKDVKVFTVEFDKRCAGLYNALMDGSWAGKVEYRKMEKTNNNGKRRKIDSPSLETRIYQHLFLNLVEPHYEKRDNLNGVNCKKGFGITAKVPSHSVVHRLKHIYYDRRYLHYALVIDQRECYAHITEKAFRRFLKRLVDDRWFVDFAVKVCFVEGRLPIGTPASPMVHHIIMLEFDYFVKTLSKASVRYADDNFLAFATKEEANAAKWRIKNWWWYNLGIRAKRQAATIMPLREAKDFCGYVFHRNGNRKACDHDKGYVSIREQTRKRASLCRNGKSWAAYFGLMKHADCYNLMLSIEKRMKLNALTQKIRIDRQMDAKHMDVKDLVGTVFCIYDYEIRYNPQKDANWIKCLVGYDEVVDGEKTGKVVAREFHGNYQGIIQFILSCEKAYEKQGLLPIEDAEIENQCGYIFKGSTNQITYIEDYESSELHRSTPAGVGGHQSRQNSVA